MFALIFGIITRIFSNSFLNTFQKLCVNSGEKSSVVNFYMYLGLTLCGLLLCGNPIYNSNLLINVVIMGILGALGNYFIIKALSEGEMSVLAPINSYKPIVALIGGLILLGEVPGFKELFGVFLIIAGTFLLFNGKITSKKALLYRFLALIFSGTEAVFIKKVIILSDINSAFLYWALAGLIFSVMIALKRPLKIKRINIKWQIGVIIAALLMQYSTNYVFSRMNVAYALALFQLSTIISVFLGVNIFKEKGLIRKLAASAVMITGAVLIILG